MIRALRIVLASTLALFALAACESTPTRIVATGTDGAEIQAQRLVAKIYGLAGDPLPYGGPDIDRPLARMQARWPELQPEIARGTIGLGDEGELVPRDFSALDVGAARALKRLVRRENADRDELYRGMTAAIGHGVDQLERMLPYTEDVFAREWARQAPAGWWLQDARGEWRRKE